MVTVYHCLSLRCAWYDSQASVNVETDSMLRKITCKYDLTSNPRRTTETSESNSSVSHLTCNQEVMNIVHIFVQITHVHTPCLALSSLYAEATSLNFCPSFNFAIASITFECFSHKICRTWVSRVRERQWNVTFPFFFLF